MRRRRGARSSRAGDRPRFESAQALLLGLGRGRGGGSRRMRGFLLPARLLLVAAASCSPTARRSDPPPARVQEPAYDGRFTFARVKSHSPGDWGLGQLRAGPGHQVGSRLPARRSALHDDAAGADQLGPEPRTGGYILALDDPEFMKYPVAYPLRARVLAPQRRGSAGARLPLKGRVSAGGRFQWDTTGQLRRSRSESAAGRPSWSTWPTTHAHVGFLLPGGTRERCSHRYLRRAAGLSRHLRGQRPLGSG